MYSQEFEDKENQSNSQRTKEMEKNKKIKAYG